jgi:hypothetical protein
MTPGKLVSTPDLRLEFSNLGMVSCGKIRFATSAKAVSASIPKLPARRKVYQLA